MFLMSEIPRYLFGSGFARNLTALAMLSEKKHQVLETSGSAGGGIGGGYHFGGGFTDFLDHLGDRLLQAPVSRDLRHSCCRFNHTIVSS